KLSSVIDKNLLPTTDIVEPVIPGFGNNRIICLNGRDQLIAK
ncbi:hypothetical protein C5L28_000279, partial [Lentilactobacillus parakefiri]